MKKLFKKIKRFEGKLVSPRFLYQAELLIKWKGTDVKLHKEFTYKHPSEEAVDGVFYKMGSESGEGRRGIQEGGDLTWRRENFSER